MRRIHSIPVLLLLIATCVQAQTLRRHDGYETRCDSLTYWRDEFELDDGTRIGRDLVKEVFFEPAQVETPDQPQPGQVPEDIGEVLALAQQQAAKYPDSDGIILLDDGTFVLNEDGTNLYRYHFRGLILKEEKKQAWGDHALYFDEKRERIRLLWARTIKPSGQVVDLDPAAVTISDEPAREVHFGAGRIFSYAMPQVALGCIVEYAYEREEFDPFDKEMFFPGYYFQAYEPVYDSRMSVVIPSSRALNYKAYNMPPDKAGPVVTQGERTTTYVWELLDVPPLIAEPQMPPHAVVVPRVTASLFEDWDYIFDWMSRMQRRRMEIKPEIRRVAEEVTAGAATTEEKVARLYHYVQQRIRYISVKGSIGSGWSGHEAFFTLQNRYGDCIDKAVLFSTMLKAQGVDSEPVVVMTNTDGEEDRAIPTMYGNHAINLVHLADKDLYLDCTSMVYRYPAFWAASHGVTTINALRRQIGFVEVPPPEANQRIYHLEVRVLPGGDAEVSYQSRYEGDYEARVRGTYAYRYKETEYGRVLANMLSGISPKASLKDYALDNVHDISKPFSIRLKYTLMDYVSPAGGLRMLGVPGVEAEFTEVALPSRKYAIAYETSLQKIQEARIVVPRGYHIKYLPPGISLETPYATYSARYDALNDSTVVFRDEFRRIKREVPVRDYAEYKDFLEQVSQYSKEQMFFEVER